MLNNLRAELIRKGFRNPAAAVANAIGCSDKTARNKLGGSTAVTVPEAAKIIETYFSGEEGMTIEYLFSPTAATA